MLAMPPAAPGSWTDGVQPPPEIPRHFVLYSQWDDFNQQMYMFYADPLVMGYGPAGMSPTADDAAADTNGFMSPIPLPPAPMVLHPVTGPPAVELSPEEHRALVDAIRTQV